MVELDPAFRGAASSTPELVGVETISWSDGRARMTLEAEDVAVIDLSR
jgi:hypothetical protein